MIGTSGILVLAVCLLGYLLVTAAAVLLAIQIGRSTGRLLRRCVKQAKVDV